MHKTAEEAFGRLLSIIQRLRGPEGCAWDRAQTPHTLRKNIIEEAYECASAVASGDDQNLREELGDLSMLVVLLSWMKEQEGSFSVRDIFDAVNEKLVRRHPHVFTDAKTDSLTEIVGQWNRIKREEKDGAASASAIDTIPGSLPPLERAFHIQEKVSGVGFDWKSPAPVWDKLHEEIGELKEAQAEGDERKIEEEVGDILFTIVNLARLLGVDPGIALHATNDKFTRRFRLVEGRLKENGLTPAEAGLAKMDELWNQIKEEEQKRSK